MATGMMAMGGTLQDRGLLLRMRQESSTEDLRGRAVVCAQAAYATPDPQKRALLIYLGEFWRQDTSQISEATATDLAVIERLEAKLLGLRITLH